MEELGGFEKGKRLVIGVYVPNDVSSPAYMVLNTPSHVHSLLFKRTPLSLTTLIKIF